MSNWQKPPLGARLIPGHPIANGLVGYWLMNEGSGNKTFDLSENGNTGTFGSNPLWVAGQLGPALQFDGNGYVDVGDMTVEGTDLTISGFINLQNIAADQRTIVGKFSGSGAGLDSFLFRVWTDGALDFWTEDAVGANGQKRTAANTIVINTWYHIAVVYDYDANDANMYVDGELQANSQLDQALTKIANTTTPLLIGSRGDGGDRLIGSVSNIGIWNVKLTPSQIATLSAEPYAMFEPEPIWLMAQSVKAVPNIMQNMNQFNGGMAC